MAAIGWLFGLFGLFGLLVTTDKSARSSAGISATDELRWTHFRWVTEGHARAALLIPLTLEGFGSPAYFQLDSGSPDNFIYSDAPAAASFSIRGPMLSGSIGQYRMTGEMFESRRNYSPVFAGAQAKNILGMLGLRFLNTRVLALDLTGSCASVADSFPEALESKVHFVPLAVRDGKMFPVVRFGEQVSQSLFLDTGASSFALIAKPDLWSRLTGHDLTDRRNENRTVAGWSEPVTLVGAKARVPIHIGPIEASDALVHAFYPSTSIAFETVDSVGLLGLELFREAKVLFIDVPRERLGFLLGDIPTCGSKRQ